MEPTFDSLIALEAELQFTRFDNNTAWRLGLWLAEKARREGLRITVSVTKVGQRVFHFAAEGTTPDNDEWIERKVRTVYRFRHSSFAMGRRLAAENISGADKYSLDDRQYSFHGGAFPLIVKGTGVVGTVAVSGLKQDQDHALCVEAVRHLLKK